LRMITFVDFKSWVTLTLILMLIFNVHCLEVSSKRNSNTENFEARIDNEVESRTFTVDNVIAAITNLTGGYFLLKAFLIYWIHLAFQTIGWGLGSLVWNSLRPGVNDLDADIPLSITDGLVNEDFAFTNLSLAAGQWVFYFAFWTLVLLLTAGQSQQASSRKTSRTSEGSQLLIALDDLFNPHTIAKQTWINILGTVGGSIWVLGLGALFPDSDQNAAPQVRSFDANANHDYPLRQESSKYYKYFNSSS